MTSPDSVLVVGASAAGLSTVEALRRKKYTGSITVLGDEIHAPYDRPPLSKQVLSGAWESDRAALRTNDALSTLEADFILGDAAVGLDSVSRTVRTASGRELQADAIVIATGVRPRVLPGSEGLGGVHVLRSLEDAQALRADLLTAARLVVVGEGVLGSEIAATARTLGVDVTMAGPQSAPMALQVGPMVSEMLAELHRDNGIRLRLGVGVVGLTEVDGHVTGVRLATDEVLPADVVVVAIGAIPRPDGWQTAACNWTTAWCATLVAGPRTASMLSVTWPAGITSSLVHLSASRTEPMPPNKPQRLPVPSSEKTNATRLCRTSGPISST